MGAPTAGQRWGYPPLTGRKVAFGIIRRRARVVEVAIVLVDGTGNTVYEWDTLLNPQRDVGPTDIHGLGPADLFNAPTFDEQLKYISV